MDRCAAKDAARLDGRPFLLVCSGVQWHPRPLTKSDLTPQLLRLFEARLSCMSIDWQKHKCFRDFMEMRGNDKKNLKLKMNQRMKQ